METIWFTSDLPSLLVSGRRSELAPIDAALRALHPPYAGNDIVIRLAGKPDGYADILAANILAFVQADPTIEKIFDNDQANLAATAIRRCGHDTPHAETLHALEELLLTIAAKTPPADDLIALAVSIARLRQTRTRRAKSLGLHAEDIRLAPLKGYWEIAGDWISSAANLAGLYKKTEQTVEAEAATLGRVNILVAGQTGVGKSTLVNAIFGSAVAQTGRGRPVTQGVEVFEPPGLPLRLFDTRGLELKDYESTLAAVKKVITDSAQGGRQEERIHLAWLCINEMSDKVQDAEVELAEHVAEYDIPVVVVLTKALSGSDAFKAEVHKLIAAARDVVRVLAERGGPVQPFGLDTLVHITKGLIPGALQAAFVAAQKVDMVLKRDAARGLLWQYASAAATAAAVPVPVAGVPAVVGANIGMITAIAARMGVQMTSATITALAGSIAAALTASTVARLAAGQVAMLFPGVGSVVGGGVNAALAGSATYALGYGFTEFLYHYGEQNGRMPAGEELQEEFKTFWSNWGGKDMRPPEISSD